MDRGAWRATVLWAAKSQTQLKQLGMHRCIRVCVCVCVCVSESLCCIAEIKHNIVNQLYFNTVLTIKK